MVIIIKPAQQNNKSHHTMPDTTMNLVFTPKNNKTALLSIAHIPSMVSIYGTSEIRVGQTFF